MIIDVVMPKMGESLQEGTIIRWTKKIGDRIERDETILEISTDKVDTEVPSPAAGILKSILYNENDTVEVGKKIAEIETDLDATITPSTTTSTNKSENVELKKEEPKIIAESPKIETTPQANTVAVSGSLTDVVMPKMGESLQEGTIIRWTKKVGDKVERDETILEISTDKVDTEVPSPVSGILAEILYKEQDTVEVGKVIARIATEGGAVIVSQPTQTESKPVAASTNEPAEESKPFVTQSASSTITNFVGKTYDIPVRDGERFYSPLVREIAIQNKVSLEELRIIPGTGTDGRVTKEDILKYISSRGSNIQQTIVQQVPVQESKAQVTYSQPKTPTPSISAPVEYASSEDVNPIFKAAGEFEVIKMDRVRQLISEHMTRSKMTSAHVTSVAEADVTEIVKFREKYKDKFFEKYGFKLTYTPFFAVAAVEGIRQFPNVNVGVDGNRIIKFKHINLSIATALDDGNLIVPVIKNAEQLNLVGIASQIYDLSTRARNKKLNPDDIQGGTFSVTNVGTFGTLFGTPVINQPQTAIMGIGAIQKRPVVKEIMGNDLILPRHMAYVSLTYDHRVIDGMLAGQCLAAICNALEAMNEEVLKF
ncbi:MAG: 2-oxoglutarate dehydrogenase, E2 component, dihydrolipoamide succinyltransferase [Candidatus Kapaibacteriota bacterium]